MATDRCLNCSADLHGPFCAACGQRSVPPDPSVKELAGDAWQELTGYDGRIAATVRGLLHPGRLMIEYLRGHRATYLPPVRVYLFASLVYFVVAAAAPPTPSRRPGEVTGPVGLRLGVWSTSNSQLTDEDRAEIRKSVETAPWLLRPILLGLAEDPEGARAAVHDDAPRVLRDVAGICGHPGVVLSRPAVPEVAAGPARSPGRVASASSTSWLRSLRS